MTPDRLAPTDPRLPETLDLMRACFAYMAGVIDPPSSLERMDIAELRAAAARSELWVWGTPVKACVLLTPKEDCLYLGKLAVAEAARGQGLSRRIVAFATERAADLQLAALELQTRVELTQNHHVFKALGFVESGRDAHAGYARPTSITFRKPL